MQSTSVRSVQAGNAALTGLRVKSIHEGKPILSPDPAQNTEVLALVDPATTIPTRRFEVVRLDGRVGTPHPLEVVELPVASGEVFGLAEVRAAGQEVKVEVDVDANHLVVIAVTDLTSNQDTRYQLTNFHQRPIPFRSPHFLVRLPQVSSADQGRKV